MGGDVMLGFKLTKDAFNLVKAGKAVLSSGGVRMPSGGLFELARPVISSSLSNFSSVAPLGPVSGCINLVSSLGANAQCAFIQKGVNAANAKLNTVITQLTSLSNALQGLQQIQVLSWVNAAFGLANCGISIAGFRMTLKKLDGVNGQLREFYDRYRLDRQNDRVEEFYKIYLDLKGHLAFLQALHKSQVLDKYEFSQREPFIEDNLNKARSFLKSVMNDFTNRRIDGRVGCQIIFTLSALYTQVMNEFCCWYYYAHSTQQSLFQDWYEIIDEIGSPAFRTFLREYLTFDLEYADISPTHKIDACKVVSESIQEQKNLLLACSESIGKISISDFYQIESVMNQGIIDALTVQMPGMNPEMLDTITNDCIANNRIVYEEEYDQVVIPITALSNQQ